MQLVDETRAAMPRATADHSSRVDQTAISRAGRILTQPVSQLPPPDVVARQIWPRQASQSLRLAPSVATFAARCHEKASCRAKAARMTGVHDDARRCAHDGHSVDS